MRATPPPSFWTATHEEVLAIAPLGVLKDHAAT